LKIDIIQLLICLESLPAAGVANLEVSCSIQANDYNPSRIRKMDGI